MMRSGARAIVLGLAFFLLACAIEYEEQQVSGKAAGAMGYLIWSHYREGTVFIAKQAFQKKDYEKVRRLLADIKKPEYLRKGRRNYYEFMCGNIALKGEDYITAERHFQIASRLPF